MGTERWCGQHHQPLAECQDWDRHVHSMRFREDDWQGKTAVAAAAGMGTVTEYYEYAGNVAGGYLRCRRGRCKTNAPPVPVVFGNLDGKTLAEWIAEAIRVAEAEHPRHRPVMIGAGTVTPGEGAAAVRFKAPAVTP